MSKLINVLGVRKVKALIDNILWYHTIDFGNGLTSKGAYDIDKHIQLYGFNNKYIKGKYVLDVGTADGYFAFLFEKMGAKAVTATDIYEHNSKLQFSVSPTKSKEYLNNYKNINLTLKEKVDKNLLYKTVNKLLKIDSLNNFFIAKDLLNSKILFKYLSVYELTQINRKYDFVFVGDLIEHLKNPIEAVEEICKVTGNVCIISLSASLMLGKSSRFDNLRSKICRYLIETKGLNYSFLHKYSITNEQVVTYNGNGTGRSFFHFSIDSFKALLVECGFKKVIVYSSFSLYHNRKKMYSPRVIFHCFV